MAHYDCSNCGAGMGIAYGYCDECTPRHVLQLKKKLDEAYAQAGREFDESIRGKRDAFIAQKMASLREEYDREYKKHDPSERKK